MILRKIRTAVLRGIRPTALIFQKQPRSKWNELDFLMLEAYQVWEDETSQTTGLPTYMTKSGDDRLGFIVHERTDMADAELQAYDEEQAKKDDKAKGTTRFAEPIMRAGGSVPEGGLAREEFYRVMNETDSHESSAFAGLPEDIRDLIEIKPDDGFDPSQYGDGA